ncbi:tyrosine-type recombinase/integrase [Nitrobacter sp. TKz-YC02]|uniref:tyrosine-type recombinase/integrase n=1 Tax=Nitrobacter sp. TKz-YC02 TaxID=3398704 RepID=UPI003CF27619
MSRQLNVLSPKFVETVEIPGRYADGGGLYLQVSAGKDGRVTKSWLFRYMRGGSTSREMGLGATTMRKGDGYTTLAQARQKRTKAREMLEAGIDPLDVKRAGKTAERIEKAKAMTFGHCSTEYIKEHAPEWKGEKHVKLWKGSLNKYVLSELGGLPVAAIDTALVLKVLKPIWATKTKTAVDVRSRIELILNWAKIHGYRDGENPARWKGHLENALPKPAKIAKITHHPAMPYDDLPGFVGKLRKERSIAAAALEWTILAAARTDDTLGFTWSEVDTEKGLWTIPAARMKADADHRVPLSDRMLEILDKLDRGTAFVFSGKTPKKKLAHVAMLKVLKAIQPGFTVHGFRSTFKDWASEQTAYSNEVSEMALAHKIPNAVEAAYRRGDLFDKRRRLMADWSSVTIRAGRI